MKDKGGQWEQTETPEDLSEQVQITQRVCGVSFLETQNLSAHGSRHLDVDDSTWSRVLDQMTFWRSLSNSTAW